MLSDHPLILNRTRAGLCQELIDYGCIRKEETPPGYDSYEQITSSALENDNMKCALCDNQDCRQGKNCTDIATEIDYEPALEIMRTAAEVESRYMELTRLEELILFCKMMKFKKIGIAFCIGLSEEAKIVHRILAREDGFEVHSVCCKVGGTDKGDLGLVKIRGVGVHETMCNPLGQTWVLNAVGTELNIILGLCIGHDILFTEHSDAPVTTLAVKDRVLAHNPLAAVYSRYYRENVFGMESGHQS